MAVIIDRLLDYQTKAENTFADLGSKYYTDAVLRNVQEGVMQGEGKPINLIIGHPHPDHVQMTHQFLCEENKTLGAKVYVNERNEGIEVAACRMNLLDMRGLPPQKVGESNGHSKDVSTGVPKFL